MFFKTFCHQVRRANLEAGHESGGRTRFQYAVPVASMIQEALMQLPEHQGTARDITDTMAAQPLYKPVLDWSLDPSRKDKPRWQTSVFYHLGSKPQVALCFLAFYRFITMHIEQLFHMRDAVYSAATRTCMHPHYTRISTINLRVEVYRPLGRRPAAG